MTASVTTASTIGASGTVSAGATLSGIVAEAKVEISATISGSTSVTLGHTYSHTITSGKYGNMQYGSFGYSVGWKYYCDSATCTSILKSSGAAKLPTTAVGWRYWETAS